MNTGVTITWNGTIAAARMTVKRIAEPRKRSLLSP